MGIRIGFNADPDPAFYVDADRSGGLITKTKHFTDRRKKTYFLRSKIEIRLSLSFYEGRPVQATGEASSLQKKAFSPLSSKHERLNFFSFL